MMGSPVQPFSSFTHNSIRSLHKAHEPGGESGVIHEKYLTVQRSDVKENNMGRGGKRWEEVNSKPHVSTTSN